MASEWIKLWNSQTGLLAKGVKKKQLPQLTNKMPSQAQVTCSQQFLLVRVDAEHRVFLVEVALRQRFDDLKSLVPFGHISAGDRLFDLQARINNNNRWGIERQ